MPQEEAGGWAFPDSYSSVTVVELDERSQSPMEQEAIEGTLVGKSTFEPCLLIKSQSNNMDLRSQSPKFSKCFSLNAKSVASSLEDLHFDAQFRNLSAKVSQIGRNRLKVRPLACSFKTVKLGPLARFSPNTVAQISSLLQATWLLRNPCLFPDFVQWRQTNSQMLYDVSSTGGSSQGQQEI